MAKRTMSWQQRRKSNLAAAVLSLVLLSGLAAYYTARANSRLAEYAELDRAGVPTRGAITGWYRQGSKTTRYVVEFRFTASGRVRNGASPVRRADYYSIWRDKPVDVLYLPSRPDSCRLAISDGPRQALDMLHVGYALIVAAIGVPLLIWVSTIRARRRM